MTLQTSLCKKNKKIKRRGYTLIEVIVVVGIILVLITMMFVLGGFVGSRDRTTNAATDLQGWLTISKAWALRDGRPNGVRLIRDPASGFVRQCIYIETADPYVGKVGSTISTTRIAKTNMVLLTTSAGFDFLGGYPEPLPKQKPDPRAPVKAGDWIEFGSGLEAVLRRIAADPVKRNEAIIEIDPAKSWSEFESITNFRVVRRPKPRIGEAVLDMQSSTVIDLNTNAMYGNFLPKGDVDIVFGPSGRLVGKWTGKTILWVRDISEDGEKKPSFGLPPFPILPDHYRLSPQLVVISNTTGMVTVQPISYNLNPPDGSKPYEFTTN